MGLSLLEITEFRNLASVKLHPVTQGFNFIHGKNGSGKTSLLEAIYYLSLARSFRSSQTERIIRYSADKLSVFAHIASDLSIPVGLERHQDGKVKLRINGEDAASIAELASLLPVQLMDSNCHHLLDSGPVFRRKYIDFALFYQKPDFLKVWRHYERALKQRNAALRHHLPKKELDIWTAELITVAKTLDELRAEYVNMLIPQLIEDVGQLLSISDLKISYQRGWDKNTDYAEVLSKTLDKDYQLGYTHSGPHKADLRILINDIPAKDILSRGQQKLFVCAMILARGTLLKIHANKPPIYLVDDLPAELDAISRTSLVSLLSKQKAQIFVTATEEDKNWDDFSTSIPMKMFHVEHGHVSEIECKRSGVMKSEYIS